MQNRVIEITKKLIEFPSVSPEDAGCQGYLSEQLENVGFSITHLPYQGASNFWAQHGSASPLFVFAGHTDVVPAGEHWDTPPFEATVKGDVLYGRGVADMKGSLAAMLVACERFLQEFPNYKGAIAWLITSAEEGPSDLGTPIVVEHLKKQGIQPNYCLVGEPTCVSTLGDTIKVGRRGSLNGYLTVYGKQGHVAYPHLAENPVHRALSALQKIATHRWDKGVGQFDPSSLQIANINAGTGATNVIPGELKIDFNIRYSPAINKEIIEKTIDGYLQQEHLHYELRWEHSAQPFSTQSVQLIAACKTAIQKITPAINPTLSTSGGTSDGRYIAPMGCELIEFGLINATIHQVNEHVKVENLEQLSLIYYYLLIELLKP